MAGLTLGVVGVVVGAASSWIIVAMVLGLVACATMLVPRQVEVGRGVEGALTAAVAVVAAVVAVMITPPDTTWYSGRLTLLFAVVSIGCVLIAALRLVLASPLGGYKVTAGITVFALLGASTAQLGPLFPALAGVYVFVQLAAMNMCDPSRPAWGEMTPRHRRAAVVGLGVAAVATVAWAIVLPPAYDWSLHRFGVELFGARSGFSTRLSLDGLGGMLQSDEVVLRIYGPRPDHLRGVVYTTYRNGRWLTPERAPEHTLSMGSVEGALGPEMVEVWSIGGDRLRHFVPLGMHVVAADESRDGVSALGIYTLPRGAEAVRTRLAPGRPREVRPSPPSVEDLVVPDPIASELESIANRWTAGQHTPEQQLDALVDRFRRDFVYSLSYRRRRGIDPIVDFIGRRTGHCEYFASAMALLARSLSIPARVVAGYRVTERNELGGYDLVRERNAHAWVEAWIPGQGWRTYDPTPPAALDDMMVGHTPWLGALVDLLGSWARQLLQWLQSRSLVELGAAVSALLVLWILVRLLRRRRSSLTGVGAHGSLEYGEPRASLVAMLDLLAQRGARRLSEEPIERFAERLLTSRELPERSRSQAAELLNRYAAWRYGGVGDPESIDAAIEQWIGGARQR